MSAGTGPADAVIRDVRTAPITLDARSDLAVHGARGDHVRSDFLLVRVRAQTSSGVVANGYGEVSATPLWSGEDGTTADHLIRTVIAPAVVGRRLAPIGRLERLMDTVLAANPFTKAGVSIALWDCWARLLNVPLAVALGGPYRDEIPIKISLSGDGDALERAYLAAVAAGFSSFKVKVGTGLTADTARVARVRELAGPDAFLAVDANGGWTRHDAARAARLLEPFNVRFVEQPCEPSDLAGARRIRALGPTVVADESVFDAADLTRVIAADAADVVSVYVGKAGGPSRAVELARLAATFGIGSIIGSNGELGIGAAVQAHVACAIPDLNVEFPCDIIGAHYYAEDILDVPLDSDGRRVRLGDGPGLGVRLRADVESQFR
ncbi:MAG TPA: enolase C-terminal domain-like protein [Pseudonocardiaceae bacterium]|nr:enolase C-terminal domain-like protein [Pseudonocardiaceae bacterium]